MKNKIESEINFSGKIKKVQSLLSVQSFLFGSFLSVYEISVTSMLVSYTEISMLPFLIAIASGFTFLINFFIRTYLQTQSQRFFVFNSLFILIPFSVFILLKSHSSSLNVNIAFISFCIVNSLILNFLSLFFKQFKLQNKIDSFLKLSDFSFFIGTLLSSVTIFLINPLSVNILLVCFLIGIFILIIFIKNRLFSNHFIITPKNKSNKMFVEFKNLDLEFKPNLKQAFLFLFFASITTLLVYVFFNKIIQLYFFNGSSVEIKNVQLFLAAFFIIKSLIQILFKYLITQKFYRNNSLLFLLLLSPIVLIIISIISFFISFLVNVNANNLVILFTSAALSHLLLSILRLEVEVIAFKNYFYSFSDKFRSTLKEYFEMDVPLIILFFAGTLLYVFYLVFSYFKNANSSLLLVQLIFIITWIVIIFQLFKKYKLSFKNVLSSLIESTKSTNNISNVESIHKKDIILYDLSISDLKSYFEFLTLNLSSKLINERLEALYIVRELYLIRLHKEVGEIASNFSSDKSGSLARDIMIEFSQDLSFHFNKEICLELGQSLQVRHRQRLASLLTIRFDFTYISNLQLLLRDNSPKVVKAAILTASYLRINEVVYSLVELLQTERYVYDAYFALLNLKEIKIETLEIAFSKEKTNKITKACIFKIISNLDSLEAREFIFNKINIQDSFLKQILFKQLLNFKWAIDVDRKWQIHELLKREFEDLSISKALYYNAMTVSVDKSILNILDNEVQTKFDTVFLLLSIIYDSQTIVCLKRMIDSKTEINYLVELVDNVLDESEKALILPYIENRTASDLYNFIIDNYSIDKMTAVELLDFILLRDINQTNRWTKVKCLQAYAKLEYPIVTDALVSHLFNKDNLLKETTARVLFDIDKQRYHTLMLRLNPQVKEDLESKMLREAMQQTESIYEKVNIITNFIVFETLTLEKISYLAEEFVSNCFMKNHIIYQGLNVECEHVYFIVNGSVSIDNEINGCGQTWKTNEFIFPGNFSINNYSITLHAVEDSIIYLLNKKTFERFLFEKTNLS